MEAVLQNILAQLPSNLVKEMQAFASEHAISVDALLSELLDNSSYSLNSLERMSESHRQEVISSPKMILELARLLWKTSWTQVSDNEDSIAV